MLQLRIFTVAISLAVATLGLAQTPAFAQGSEPPYWAAMRYNKVFMRAGPGQDYPIEWVYQREGLPVKVIRKQEGWRLVRDPDGAQGWVSATQLVRERAALVIGEGLVVLREAPMAASGVRWRAQPGVVSRLVSCREDWCEINVSGRTGWVKADRLWGDEDPKTTEPDPAPASPAETR